MGVLNGEAALLDDGITGTLDARSTVSFAAVSN
jgi:hypothetical protein